MPASRDKNDKYGTDPYGIVRRGPPGGDSAASISFGKVGAAVPSAVSGGKSMGSGMGVTVKAPFGKKSGGPAKNASGGYSVKAYGDMIKKAAGGKVQTSSDTARKLATEMGGMSMGGKPVKKAKGGSGKVRKGMMSPEGTILQAVKPKKGLGGM
jgi:hypothetical protein